MAAPLQLPRDFEKSYEDFLSYPCNLVCKTSYLGTLKTYKARLQDASTTLFNKPNGKMHVPFRDWNATSQMFDKQNILSDVKLKEWLGDQSVVDPLTSSRVGPLATRRDPKCRFIFIYSDLSRKPLNITQEMLLRILSYHQVMPSYLDFLSVFGTQMEPRDLRFNSFHAQTTLSTNGLRGPAVPAVGRSGRQYQMCYNLKAVACISDSWTATRDKEWSIRQAAFHHQFDVDEGTTLWISTKGRLEDLKERVQDLTGKDGRLEDRSYGTPEECFKSSLSVHLMYCHWSAEEWRWYIRWLEDVINQETQIAVIGPRNPGQFRRIYVPEDLQTIQYYEDKTNEASMILDANVKVMTSLREYYEKLLENDAFPFRDSCREDILTFAAQTNDMIYDSNMQISRAKLLVQISADRKSLVVQHLQSQATEKMEMMTAMSYKETIAMRIITVVTLVYLPATFVSTFFSTDVVKYQNQDGGNGNFSLVAMIRWLEVALPLTAVTLAVGWAAYRLSHRKNVQWLPLYKPD